jgi:hypothetical protein
MVVFGDFNFSFLARAGVVRGVTLQLAREKLARRIS